MILDNINSYNISCEHDGCMINSVNSEIFNLTNSDFNNFISTKNAGILSIVDPKEIIVLNSTF